MKTEENGTFNVTFEFALSATVHKKEGIFNEIHTFSVLRSTGVQSAYILLKLCIKKDQFSSVFMRGC